MGGFGGWGLGVVFMLLLWLLVILGILALLRWLQSPSSRDPAAGGKTPLEIVQERYARGQIDKDEYEQKKRDPAS